MMMADNEPKEAASEIVAAAAAQAQTVVDTAADRASTVVDTAADRASTVVDTAADKAASLVDAAAGRAVEMVKVAAVAACAQIQEQTANLNHSLGRMEGTVEHLIEQAKESQQAVLAGFAIAAQNREKSDAVMHEHITNSAIAAEKMERALVNITAVVERIRGPVDTYLAVKRVFISIAAILTALGVLLGLSRFIHLTR